MDCEDKIKDCESRIEEKWAGMRRKRTHSHVLQRAQVVLTTVRILTDADLWLTTPRPSWIPCTPYHWHRRSLSNPRLVRRTCLSDPFLTLFQCLTFSSLDLNLQPFLFPPLLLTLSLTQ